MRRLTPVLSLLYWTLSAVLLIGAVGCPRPSNPTSQKGVGGFPTQNFDSSKNIIAWSVPDDLKYPNWQQMYPGNNRIYLVPDSVEKVATYYLGKLPGSSQQEINGKRHVVVKNDSMSIDIESGSGNTKIVLSPNLSGKKEE